MTYDIKIDGKFRFIEEGEGEPLMLLHGLFGALSNFEELIEYFRHHYKVVVPMLPLFDLDLLRAQEIFGVSLVVDVGAGAKPSNDLPARISYRRHPCQKWAEDAVGATQRKDHVKDRAGRQRCPPAFQH